MDGAHGGNWTLNVGDCFILQFERELVRHTFLLFVIIFQYLLSNAYIVEQTKCRYNFAICSNCEEMEVMTTFCIPWHRWSMNFPTCFQDSISASSLVPWNMCDRNFSFLRRTFGWGQRIKYSLVSNTVFYQLIFLIET